MTFPSGSCLTTGHISVAARIPVTRMCDFGSNTTSTQDSGKSDYCRGVVSFPTRSTGYGNVKPMAHTGGNPGGGDSLAISSEGLERENEVARIYGTFSRPAARLDTNSAVFEST